MTNHGGYFDVDAILKVGITTAHGSMTAAYYLLPALTAIGYALSYAGLAVPGRAEAQNPLRVLARAFGVGVVLLLYWKLTHFITAEVKQVVDLISKASDMEVFFSHMKTSYMDRFGFVGTDKSVAQVFWELDTGIFSFIAVFLGLTAAVIMLNLFWAVQACFLAILLACGPLAIACSLAPGADGLMRRWFTAFVEVATWPIFAAIVLEMLAVGAEKIINAKSDSDWFALLVLCTVLILMIACVPTIASRLVGQGFGAVGPMLMSAARMPAGIAGKIAGQMNPTPSSNGPMRPTPTAASAVVSVGKGVLQAGSSMVNAASTLGRMPSPPTRQLAGLAGNRDLGKPTLGERERRQPSLANQESSGPSEMKPSEVSSAAPASGSPSDWSGADPAHAPKEQEAWKGLDTRQAQLSEQGPSLRPTVATSDAFSPNDHPDRKAVDWNRAPRKRRK